MAAFTDASSRDRSFRLAPHQRSQTEFAIFQLQSLNFTVIRSSRPRSRNSRQEPTGPNKRSLYSHAISAAQIRNNHGECNMKMLVTKMFTSFVLFATLVAAETAHAQTPHRRDLPNAHRDGAPTTADDSWETGVAGARVRVQPDDAIEAGRVAGQDPDPNIRSQLQREYNEGGDGD
jgi:hypothetical protein